MKCPRLSKKDPDFSVSPLKSLDFSSEPKCRSSDYDTPAIVEFNLARMSLRVYCNMGLINPEATSDFYPILSQGKSRCSTDGR